MKPCLSLFAGRFPIHFMRAGTWIPLFALLFSGCNFGPGYTLRKLPSGRTVRVTGIEYMFLPQIKAKALKLNYRTEYRLNDLAHLRPEAEEVFQDFLAHMNPERYSGCVMIIISAHAPPKGFIITSDDAYNFVASKDDQGQWVLGSENDSKPNGKPAGP